MLRESHHFNLTAVLIINYLERQEKDKKVRKGRRGGDLYLPFHNGDYHSVF